MSHQSQRYSNGETAEQHQQGCVENRSPPIDFQREIQRLGSLLEMERARRLDVNQKLADTQRELEDAKAEVERQKTVKKIFINRSRELKRELQAVKTFNNPETLSPAVIPSKVCSQIRDKTKMQLQEDLAQIVNEDAFMSQIKAEKEKNNALQQELDHIKACYEELRPKSEANIGEEKLQVDMQLVYEDKIRQDQNLLDKMFKQISSFKETNKRLQRELEQMNGSYQELKRRYEADVSALRQQNEGYQHEMTRVKDAHLEKTKNDLIELIKKLRAEKDDLNRRKAEDFSFLQRQSNKTTKHVRHVLQFSTVIYQELKARYEGNVSALIQQEEIFRQNVEKEMKAYSEKMMSDMKMINKLKAEKDSLLKQLTAYQQLHSGCELKYKTEQDNRKTELQHRDKLRPPRQNVDRLSEDTDVPDASPKEVKDFVEGMLREMGVMEVTEEPVETAAKKKSVWKKIRHSLRLFHKNERKTRKLLNQATRKKGQVNF
ncbi:paramyosin-like [Gambusia affinis]|uniref:paramyosin-like n=1 Tax=Gambusia affinis TaxID=33528 RepID=UPI001CDC74D4|nr:paramyosin-like [Gambusia affinis]